MAKKSPLPDEEVQKEKGAKIRNHVWRGELNFVVFTEQARLNSKYVSDKYNAQFRVKKSPETDEMVEYINAYSRLCGGGDIIKDGDEDEKTYNRGHWYGKAKLGRNPRLVDVLKKDIPGSAFDNHDYVQFRLSPFAYEAAGRSGVSLYFRDIMLIDKRGNDDLPDYDGNIEQSYVHERYVEADRHESGLDVAEIDAEPDRDRASQAASILEAVRNGRVRLNA